MNDGGRVVVEVGFLSIARVCFHQPECKGQDSLSWEFIVFLNLVNLRGGQKQMTNCWRMPEKKKRHNFKILMQGLLTLAVLAVLVAGSNRVHAVAGGAVGGWTV